MSTVRASRNMNSRALLRPRLRSVSRPNPTSRRTFADERTQAQQTSSTVTPLALGGLGLGVAAALYYVSSKQKDVVKSDHNGQESYRTEKPRVHNVSMKDLDSSKDPSRSNLPNDAPNNPANLDKME